MTQTDLNFGEIGTYVNKRCTTSMPRFEITVPMLRRPHTYPGFASIDFAVLKLYSARAADGSVTVTPLQVGSPQYGSEGGPVTLPVFKTGDRRLRCQWCVRLAHASAKTAMTLC